MHDTIGWLILLVVGSLLCGPLALILSVKALNQLSDIERRFKGLKNQAEPTEPMSVIPTPLEMPSIVVPTIKSPAEPSVSEAPQEVQPSPVNQSLSEMLTLEQRIGTQWVLVAGVVSVIFAVGYFLKYAYDNQWITPVSQVIVSGIAGLGALAIGELTRRRGYGVVAKGVTAMGFAILYATVFTANRWHHLITSPPAYALAGIITLAAMAYAVGFDEIVAALLALVGGYFTPVVVSTGHVPPNRPMSLFSYVLILSGGAMLCAYWRRWTAVNVVAWIGTYFLYASWFERFYRPVIHGPTPPQQLGIALFWLTAFFLVFLILPILNGLRRRVKSQLQDVVLIPINAAVVLYYLWTILGHNYRTWLALCCVVLGGVHLAMAIVAAVRCKEDVNLRQVLLVIGLAAVTLAVPLYWRRYTIPAALAIEAVILVVTGIRYRSLLVQVAAAAVVAIASGWLAYLWPMHNEPFQAVFNPAFGTWCLVAAAILVGHLLYRFNRQADIALRPEVALNEGLYVIGLLLFMAAISAEFWFHVKVNIGSKGPHDSFIRQMILVFPAFVLLFLARPICPRGLTCPVIASALAATGAAYLLGFYSRLHHDPFLIFANVSFAEGMVQVAALFTGGYLLIRSDALGDRKTPIPAAFGLTAVVVLWVLLTLEIWLFFHWSSPGGANRQWLAQMWISVMWAGYGTALMVAGFWRNIRLLRYMALALFLLLLGKIFLWDTSTLRTEYRIAGFLATGLALVGISYLYQFLKKKGFFDKILADTDKQ
jgi:uncharacterized membrane protein